MNAALNASEVMTRATPVDVYAWLDSLFGFTVDVCATADNAKHPRFFSPAENGLAQSWRDEVAFMNPPYGRAVAGWTLKARDEAMAGAAVVGLLAGRIETQWYRNAVMQADAEAGRLLQARYVPLTRVHWYRWQRLVVATHVVEERIPFDGLDGAPFPSVVVVWAHPSRGAREPSREYTRVHSHRPWLTLGWPR